MLSYKSFEALQSAIFNHVQLLAVVPLFYHCISSLEYLGVHCVDDDRQGRILERFEHKRLSQPLSDPTVSCPHIHLLVLDCIGLGNHQRNEAELLLIKHAESLCTNRSLHFHRPVRRVLTHKCANLKDISLNLFYLILLFVFTG